MVLQENITNSSTSHGSFPLNQVPSLPSDTVPRPPNPSNPNGLSNRSVPISQPLVKPIVTEATNFRPSNLSVRPVSQSMRPIMRAPTYPISNERIPTDRQASASQHYFRPLNNLQANSGTNNPVGPSTFTASNIVPGVIRPPHGPASSLPTRPSEQLASQHLVSSILPSNYSTMRSQNHENHTNQHTPYLQGPPGVIPKSNNAGPVGYNAQLSRPPHQNSTFQRPQNPNNSPPFTNMRPPIPNSGPNPLVQILPGRPPSPQIQPGYPIAASPLVHPTSLYHQPNNLTPVTDIHNASNRPPLVQPISTPMSFRPNHNHLMTYAPGTQTISTGDKKSPMDYSRSSVPNQNLPKDSLNAANIAQHSYHGQMNRFSTPNAHSLNNFSHQSPSPKVNPAMIPSVVAVLEADETRFKESSQPFYTFSSIVENPPPLPSTRCVSIVDDGNSSTQYIRSTLNHVPISEEICDNSKIPLSLLIQPFSSFPQNEVPLVDFGPMGPIRCHRCRAYINPHVQFIKGGRFFVCNLCGMNNEVPDEYYANLDMSGKRIDSDLRPELKFGTVDFVASKEYYTKPAEKPYILFVIDSSRAAVSIGSFNSAIESIKSFVSNEASSPNYGGMGILIHDRSMTFYVLREGKNEPQVLVMNDISDPFIPLHPNDLFFDPFKCSSQLNILLNHLNSNFSIDSRPVDSCFGSVVSVALDSLKVRGGRAIFFQTTLPSLGPGALKNRESSTSGNINAPADKAHPLLFPQTDYYSKLGIQAAQQGISLSLVLTPAAHIDLASIGPLYTNSSGKCFFYPRFIAQQHTSRLVGEISSFISNRFSFDCLARIRCGSGLQVKKHYGNFYSDKNGHDLSFGSISNDQSFAALLEYDGKLSDKDRISFQVAVLHTDSATGQRRIRVLNMSLPCTSSIQSIFRMAELDTILSFYLKKNISQILEAPASAFPASFTAKCINILAAYRKYCAANMSSGQLILPDSLKLFPILTLAIHKDAAFNISNATADSRWFSIHRLTDLPLNLTVRHFYPQLLPLSGILEHEEVLPASIRLSREHVLRDGLYLLNDGHSLLLYVGDNVNPVILKEIFGISQLNSLNLGTSNSIPIIQNARSAKLRQIITVLRSQYPGNFLNLRLVRQSVDISEDSEFSQQLVEDSTSTSPSYVDFLCKVHSQIQHSLTQGSTLSLAERTSILSFLQ